MTVKTICRTKSKLRQISKPVEKLKDEQQLMNDMLDNVFGKRYRSCSNSNRCSRIIVIDL